MKVNDWDFPRLKKETEKGRKLICLGAGMVACHIGFLMEQYGLLSRVLFWTDQDEKKSGSVIEVEGRRFDIKSKDVLGEERYKDAILFITFECPASAVREILNGWKIEPEDGCTCLYAVNEQISQTVQQESGKGFGCGGKETDDFLIPPIIHYCWFGRGKMPDFQMRLIDNWHKICPAYEILLWNEENYDLGKCRYIYQAYEEGYYAFVSDYVRMDVVYQMGGMYFDTDVALYKNIDMLRKNIAFFTYGKWPAINSGSGFGAVRGHWLVREIRDEPRGSISFSENGKCNKTTNCFYETEIISKYGFRMDFTSQNIEGIQVFSPRYFPTGTYLKEYKMPFEDVIALHYDAGSWRD